jgi:hypothetical protein
MTHALLCGAVFVAFDRDAFIDALVSCRLQPSISHSKLATGGKMEPTVDQSLRHRRSVKPIEFEEVTYVADDGGETDQGAVLHTTTTLHADDDAARPRSPEVSRPIMTDVITINTIILRQLIRNAMAAIFVVLFLHVLRAATQTSSSTETRGGQSGLHVR